MCSVLSSGPLLRMSAACHQIHGVLFLRDRVKNCSKIPFSFSYELDRNIIRVLFSVFFLLFICVCFYMHILSGIQRPEKGIMISGAIVTSSCKLLSVGFGNES